MRRSWRGPERREILEKAVGWMRGRGAQRNEVGQGQGKPRPLTVGLPHSAKHAFQLSVAVDLCKGAIASVGDAHPGGPGPQRKWYRWL